MQPPLMTAWIITMAFPDPSETFACNDVLALGRAGVKVEVHCLRPKNRLFSQLVQERDVTGIWITHNSIVNTLHGFWLGLIHPLLSIDFILWIFKYTWTRPKNLFKSLLLVPRSLQIFDSIQQKQPEIVHLYWSHFPALVGYLVQHRLPQVCVSMAFVAHDVYYSEFNSKHSYSGSVARHADLIQSITAANIPAIERYGISKEDIQLSYHGVDLTKVPAKKEKIKHRIVTAGRLIPDKGFDDVLKIFSRVLLDWPDSSLVILGDGSERKTLEALATSLKISHAVDFRGFISHDEIFAEMAVAEVFLFMSKAERLPNVVKEAMACHCLCVTSHTPGIEELVIDQIHGYIVPQEDNEGAALRVHQAFSNPEKTTYMTEVAYQHLRTHFDLDRIIEDLRDKWMQLLTTKKYSGSAMGINYLQAKGSHNLY